MKLYSPDIIHRMRQSHNDDILIIKNGFLTDTSYCNIALYDGRRWVTPSTPLLPGTARRLLLEKGMLQERGGRREDLDRYKYIRLVNAMLPWSPSLDLEVRAVTG